MLLLVSRVAAQCKKGPLLHVLLKGHVTRVVKAAALGGRDKGRMGGERGEDVGEGSIEAKVNMSDGNADFALWVPRKIGAVAVEAASAAVETIVLCGLPPVGEDLEHLPDHHRRDDGVGEADGGHGVLHDPLSEGEVDGAGQFELLKPLLGPLRDPRNVRLVIAVDGDGRLDALIVDAGPERLQLVPQLQLDECHAVLWPAGDRLNRANLHRLRFDKVVLALHALRLAVQNRLGGAHVPLGANVDERDRGLRLVLLVAVVGVGEGGGASGARSSGSSVRCGDEDRPPHDQRGEHRVDPLAGTNCVHSKQHKVELGEEGRRVLFDAVVRVRHSNVREPLHDKMGRSGGFELPNIARPE